MPSRLQATRLEKCLGGTACLVALAAGVVAGLLWRRQLDDGELLAQRRAEVAAMSAAEKDQLRVQYRRFSDLPREDQQRLRQLDAELSSAEDAQELRQTLRRYHRWLRTVSLMQSRELVDLSGEPDRKALRVEELSPLSRADAAAVEAWLKDCVRARFPSLGADQVPFWGQWLVNRWDGFTPQGRPPPTLLSA
jgi:hypothetical protein